MVLGSCLDGPFRFRRRTSLAAAAMLVLVSGAGWMPVSGARAATLAVTTSSLPTARQVSTYSTTLTAAGGTAPYHWSLSGSLPAGLSLSTAGVISGTATSLGTTNATFKVTDSARPTAASATRTLPLTVLAALNQSVIYVLNGEDAAVTEYAPGASGDAPPIAQIYGSNTQMGRANGFAVTPARRVYVAGWLKNGSDAVFQFAPDVNGNVAPQTVITGPAAGLSNPTDVAVDKAGDMWVANHDNATITEYAPTASGNAAPKLTLGGPATGLNAPFRLTFDVAGNLWVSNRLQQNSTVTEYAVAALQQTSTQPVNLAPIGTLASTSVQTATGLAFDSLGGLHVEDITNARLVGFAPGAPNGNPAPAWNIAGSNTELADANGVAADPAGRLYVASGLLTEFNYNATGNVPPVVTIGGLATQLDGALDAAAVPPRPLAYAGVTPLRLTLGGRYSSTLPVLGGIGPYSFTVASGSLPAGMTLGGNGVLSGVPTTLGTSTATIRITDSARPAASITQTLQLIVAAPAALAISTSTLPATEVGQSYSTTLAASGGVPPDTWEVTAGALPDGLSLSPSGKITGTPTQMGTFTFTVTVTDSSVPISQTASATRSVLVKAQPGVYATNAGNDSVTEYPLRSGGDIAPIADIVGPDTGLSTPEGVVVDAVGDVFVANEGNNTVTEYAPGASGDARPTATIGGVSTPCRLALSGSGDLYVASLSDSISKYSVGSGAPKLITTITGQTQPRGLALDAGGHLWVSESTINTINEYSATASGNSAPIASIAGPDTGLASPQGLVFDSAGNLTAANAGGAGISGSVTVYAAGHLTGDAVPTTTLTSGLTLPLGVDRGTDQTIFVSDVSANAIVEYAPGATTWSTLISGPNTQLDSPVGVAATPPLSIVTKRLPAAHRGRRYLVNLTAAEGTTPYRWKVVHGRLPRGLRLRKTGAIIGTPHGRAHVYRFTVRVRDRTRPTQVVTQRLRLRLKASRHPRRHHGRH
jgi:hypothetical protein